MRTCVCAHVCVCMRVCVAGYQQRCSRVLTSTDAALGSISNTPHLRYSGVYHNLSTEEERGSEVQDHPQLQSTGLQHHLHQQTNKRSWAGHTAQKAECLPSMCQVLGSSIPQPHTNKTWTQSQCWLADAGGQPQLQSEFQASLGYVPDFS